MGSNRLDRGREGAEFKGGGSTYIIPASDMPDGVKSGQKIIAKIHGIITVDEQGGVIEVEKIEIENVNSREDPLQKEIEDGLDKGMKIEVNIQK
jgi:hypothetical protein